VLFGGPQVRVPFGTVGEGFSIGGEFCLGDLNHWFKFCVYLIP